MNSLKIREQDPLKQGLKPEEYEPITLKPDKFVSKIH